MFVRTEMGKRQFEGEKFHKDLFTEACEWTNDRFEQFAEARAWSGGESRTQPDLINHIAVAVTPFRSERIIFDDVTRAGPGEIEFTDKFSKLLFKLVEMSQEMDGSFFSFISWHGHLSIVK